MAGLNQLLSQCLEDRKITDDEVYIIREQIERDGRLDMEDVRFLTQLLSEADEVCPAFDELFFPALKQVLLADGEISQAEQFYLLKMLYSDGNVRQREKRFLAELRREAQNVSPAFDALCETAFATDAREWELGGS